MNCQYQWLARILNTPGYEKMDWWNHRLAQRQALACQQELEQDFVDFTDTKYIQLE